MWTPWGAAIVAGSLTAWLIWSLGRLGERRRARRHLTNRLNRLESRVPPVDLLETTAQRRYSHLPVIRDLLQRLPVTQAVLRWLEQSGVRINVSMFVTCELCSVLAGGLAAAWLRWPAAAVAGVAAAGGVVPVWWIAQARRQRLRQLSDQLPDAVRMISSSLRAGLSLDAGLHLVASELSEPIRTEFRRLVNEAMLQADVDRAFHRMAQRMPSADMRLFSAASCLHRDVGGNFAQMLDQLETTIRERVHLHRELHSLTAESRLSGWVLGVLPFLVALGITCLSPSYLAPLLTTPVGRTLLAAALGLQAGGAVLIWWFLQPRFR